jgi:hypothetical protein
MTENIQKRNIRSFVSSVRRWMAARHEGLIVTGLIVLVLIVYSVPR